ncbi:protein of unknown function [Xenorhabdus poinarii G6]|uniref:Uncharacterized protein n=1 Tax=Xenorhabdus poinarii G6 TaxID=1354304 RepID=A0A068R487_9GAMM|nr:hypothetical protein [Xenorhabdus poinarii]CDG21711.1 protein of unknown function [Xenorhabdus poinarii G6]
MSQPLSGKTGAYFFLLPLALSYLLCGKDDVVNLTGAIALNDGSHGIRRMVILTSVRTLG